MTSRPVPTPPQAPPSVEPRWPPAPDFALYVGVVALAAFGVLAASLGRFEWLDARVGTAMDALRGCAKPSKVEPITDAAPWVAVAFVAIATGYARLRGASLRTIVTALVVFALALIEIQALKTLFERDRPGIPPWLVAGGQSYPSGHVANAAVCVVTAAILALRGVRGLAPRLAIIVGGMGFVLGVAATRLYLNRHYLTDTVGAILLGVAFWGILAARERRWSPLVIVLVALQLAGTYGAVAAGGRVHLPAPTALADHRPGHSGVLRGHRLRHLAGGVRMPPQRAQSSSIRLVSPTLGFAVHPTTAEPLVLKVVALPLRGIVGGPCAWLTASVDGTRVMRVPMKARWRSYGIALPALTAGTHAIELHFQTIPGPQNRAGIAVAALSVEGPAGAVRIVPLPRGTARVTPPAPMLLGCPAADDDGAPS